MSSVSVTMPRWPAYVMGAFMIACAYPALTSPAPEPPSESPRALGRETAQLAIANGGGGRFADLHPTALPGQAHNAVAGALGSDGSEAPSTFAATVRLAAAVLPTG